MSSEDYTRYKYVDRICCEQVLAFVKYENIDLKDEQSRLAFTNYLKPFVPDAGKLTEQLCSFAHMEAKLPSHEKQYIPAGPIEIAATQNREEIIDYLQNIRQSNTTADLAFYAYRDMATCDWQPFIKAAIERNPVSIEAAAKESVEELYNRLCAMDDDSIYDGKRLAQPDEVVNFATGDGIEKAILLANVIKAKDPLSPVEIDIDNKNVLLKAQNQYRFTSSKAIKKTLVIDRR